jgi:3-phenylpropionate/trans-cinnamate dioxygenase ferredoxin subunit
MNAIRYTAVADEHELAPGQMKTVAIAGRRILLVNAEGTHYAVDEMCSHEDYSLALGCVKDRSIKCSLHGSYFDLATGEPTEEPASEPIRTYPVRVADGKVWVSTG